MSSVENKIWFSFFANTPYKGDEPAYFDVSNSNWHDLIQKSIPIFKKEIETQQEVSFIPYSNNTLANEPNKWNFIPLRSWGKNYNKNIVKFPLTQNVIKQVPYLVSAAFSQLDNSSQIKPHSGDSNAMFRVHVPITIPQGLPNCGFEVLGIKRDWKDGFLFAFCDAHKHYAWNNTNEKRIVLILDIIRPEFESKSNWICAQIRASLMFQFMFQKTKIINRTPRLIRKLIMKCGGIIIFPFIYLFGNLKTS